MGNGLTYVSDSSLVVLSGSLVAGYPTEIGRAQYVKKLNKKQYNYHRSQMLHAENIIHFGRLIFVTDNPCLYRYFNFHQSMVHARLEFMIY